MCVIPQSLKLPAPFRHEIRFAHAEWSIQKLSFPLKAGTRTNTVPLSISVPQSSSFICLHHPSWKLVLKRWRFIKATATRSTSIFIPVLWEKPHFWGWERSLWLRICQKQFTRRHTRLGKRALRERGIINYILLTSSWAAYGRNVYRRGIWRVCWPRLIFSALAEIYQLSFIDDSVKTARK